VTGNIPIIAITLGDPGGIGPEVTLKALSLLRKGALLKQVRLLLLGPLEVYESWNQKCKLRLAFNPIPFFEPKILTPGILHVLDIEKAFTAFPISTSRRFPLKVIPSTYEIGRISEKNACLAYASLRIGAYLASCGMVQGLVTAPIHKQALRLLDSRFVGHTEYLARVSGTKKVAMMFDGGKLKVTLVSIHVPLRKVPALIKQENIQEKIDLTNRFLKKFYCIKKPRIAVTALNPHGEEFGNEEKREIVPAVRLMQKRKVKVFGPFSGDQIFYEASRGKYDAVIAMYHDQGLGPLKTLAFDRAVNVTLGLPFVRTSPDHGTAFDIAGKNLATSSSMQAAIQLACRFSVKGN